jgi:uncharacterized protein (TIGR04222 family)
VLAAVVGGCTEELSLLDLRGPEFLRFYGMALGCALVLSLLVVRLLRGGEAEPPQGQEVDPYEAAYLGGGGGRTVSAAFASLYGHRLVEFGSPNGGKTQVKRIASAPPGMHDVERAVHLAVPSNPPAEVREVRKSLMPLMETWRERLVHRGWILPPEEVSRFRWLAAVPFIVLLAVGAMKLFVGVERDKPVFFLIMLLFFTIIVMVMRLAAMRKRTNEGQAVWQNLRATRREMKSRLERSTAAERAVLISMGVALLGTQAFAAAGYEPLRQALGPTGAEGSSSGCGSSCGGGGSSGCGGGGGCGGCGGGD